MQNYYEMKICLLLIVFTTSTTNICNNQDTFGIIKGNQNVS